MENRSLGFRVCVEMVRFLVRLRVRTDAVEAQFFPSLYEGDHNPSL